MLLLSVACSGQCVLKGVRSCSISDTHTDTNEGHGEVVLLAWAKSHKGTWKMSIFFSFKNLPDVRILKQTSDSWV